MKIDVLLGLQWGDEGKGKIVDVLTPRYDVIARFQGGPNAGHSLEFNQRKFVLHSIPSGIFHDDKMNIIGNGVVLDPASFKKEVDELAKIGTDLTQKLAISKKTHLILPSHRILDAASEHQKGKTKIGSTLKGIGPTYMDKTGRNGLRVGDILTPDFKEKYDFLTNKHQKILQQYDFEYSLEQMELEWFAGIELIRKFKLIDSEFVINDYRNSGKKVLAEGAQGTLLDIDFGSYPFVTSSNTLSAGACIGLGIAPSAIGEVYGIFKAYCTRVGNGAFPSELFDDNGTQLQKHGNEFGATTGRPRRCGWLDLVALKYAIMLNGVTQLIMTKADVLNSFDKFSVVTAYKVDGVETKNMPFDINNTGIKPVYKEFVGWKQDFNAKTFRDLPVELRNYIEFIEQETGVPVAIVSVGPDREETIVR